VSHRACLPQPLRQRGQQNTKNVQGHGQMATSVRRTNYAVLRSVKKASRRNRLLCRSHPSLLAPASSKAACQDYPALLVVLSFSARPT
jgi:hypothetical protein